MREELLRLLDLTRDVYADTAGNAALEKVREGLRALAEKAGAEPVASGDCSALCMREGTCTNACAPPQPVAMDENEAATDSAAMERAGFRFDGSQWVRPPSQPVALTKQSISDRFDFLEGLVNETTYRQIVDEAALIAAESSAVSRQPVALPDDWRAIAEIVLSLSHAGDCRVWQYGADEDRCECGVKDAKAKASALLAAAPEVPR